MTQYIHEPHNELVPFRWPGQAFFLGVIGTRNGYPVGEYIPPGTARAKGPKTGNTYQASGGVIHAECRRMLVVVGGRTIHELWRMRSFRYTGDIHIVSSGSSPTGGGGGWSWAYDGGYPAPTGAGSDWQQALARYMSGGGCTGGYAIYMNGGQVCSGEFF